ncbi:MAG: hypothetical protein J6577_01325 [Gilliamella sp.]|nr:hypothetical protein [Gilliamella sp.]
MAHSFYLKKTSQQPTPIDIQINAHNPKGWVEKSNGQVIKLHKKLIAD